LLKTSNIAGTLSTCRLADDIFDSYVLKKRQFLEVTMENFIRSKRALCGHAHCYDLKTRGGHGKTVSWYLRVYLISTYETISK
jgi:hypothetical protein